MELIERQAAVDHLVDNMTWYDEDGCESDEDAKRHIIEELMNGVPPVQPKSGEWKYHSNPNIGVNMETAYCSCCGFRVDTTGDIDFDEYNFCPRCGAKMEG